MLLERGMAKEALAAFEATMAKEPNRFNGFAGAAKAARQARRQGESESQLSKSWSRLQATTPTGLELAALASIVASN